MNPALPPADKGMTGSCVWADSPPPPTVTFLTLVMGKQDENTHVFLDFHSHAPMQRGNLSGKGESATDFVAIPKAVFWVPLLTWGWNTELIPV